LFKYKLNFITELSLGIPILTDYPNLHYLQYNIACSMMQRSYGRTEEMSLERETLLRETRRLLNL